MATIRKKERMTRWIFVSDLQLGLTPKYREESRRRLIERVAAERPHFVIHGGDHVAGKVNDSPEERRDVELMWAAYHRVMAPLKQLCPVISTIGNHDQTGSTPSSEEYLRQVGRQGKATYHAKTIGGVHVAILDVLVGKHRGGFADPLQVRWLRRDLRATRRAGCTVVVGHYPILVAPWLLEHSVLRDEQPGESGLLLPMLLDGGVDLYLCGHLHAYERAQCKTMTQVMTSASDIFFPDMRERPGEFTKAFDERQTYIRFALEDSTIRGEAISAEGDVVDQWTQKLNLKAERKGQR
jgi:predicted phosphodiesterase